MLTLLDPLSAAGATRAPAGAGGSGAWPWPLLGEVITPYRNVADPYAAGQHRGIDVAAPVGATVRAVVDGAVSFSGRLPDGGQAVTVRSADGRWLVSSLHLSSRAVSRGERIVAGAVLGRVGTSGRRSAERPHLHLSVRHAGDRSYVDPLTLLGAPRVAPAPEAVVADAAPAAVGSTAQQPAAAQAQTPRAATSSSATVARTTQKAARPAVSRTAAAGRGDRQQTGHFERTAPPPLRPAELDRRELPDRAEAEPEVAVEPLTAPLSQPMVATAETPSQHSADDATRRRLLLVIAIVCIAALVMRRRVAGEAARPRPTAGRSAGGCDVGARNGEPPSDQTAEILPFRRVGHGG